MNIMKIIKDIKCKFKDYGNEERLCSKCGYVIPNHNNVHEDDIKEIKNLLELNFPIPKCGGYIW